MTPVGLELEEAVQDDVARLTTSWRRSLSARRASGLRSANGIATALIGGWLVATMGWAAWTGALPTPITTVLPLPGGVPVMALALAIFVLGAALVVLGVYAITAIAYGLRRRGARA